MRGALIRIFALAIATSTTATGCALTSTEIVLTDPHQASLFIVADGKRTRVLEPELVMPPPPTSSVERAIWESHDMSYYRAATFPIERPPNDDRGEGVAFRFARGGISIAYLRVPRVSQGRVTVLDDDGVLHLGEFLGDYRGRTWRIDSTRCVVVVTQPMFSASGRRVPHVKIADVELEVPLTAVRVIRNIRAPVLSHRQVVAIYPPESTALLR